jgi:hypothetical protein
MIVPFPLSVRGFITRYDHQKNNRNVYETETCMLNGRVRQAYGNSGNQQSYHTDQYRFIMHSQLFAAAVFLHS